MKKGIITAITAVAFVSGLLTGCGDTVSRVDNSKSTSSTSGAAPASAPEQTQKVDNLTIGDTVNFNGLHITLNKAMKSDGTEFEKPQNGQYIIIQLTIENTTTQQQAVSTMMQMHLSDADGVTSDPTIYTETKGNLDGEVLPGKKLVGEVAFDVKKSSMYEFDFTNPFGDGQASWKFKG